MPTDITYAAKHRSEKLDVWQGRVTGLAASGVVTVPLAAKEIVAVQYQAIDGSPNVVWRPNTTRAKNFYCIVGTDESVSGFDATVWYIRGNGATLSLGNTGTTTTTTTTSV